MQQLLTAEISADAKTATVAGVRFELDYRHGDFRAKNDDRLTLAAGHTIRRVVTGWETADQTQFAVLVAGVDGRPIPAAYHQRDEAFNGTTLMLRIARRFSPFVITDDATDRSFGFASEAVYEAASAWTTRTGKARVVEFCANHGLDLHQPANDATSASHPTLVDDWRNAAAELYARVALAPPYRIVADLQTGESGFNDETHVGEYAGVLLSHADAEAALTRLARFRPEGHEDVVYRIEEIA